MIHWDTFVAMKEPLARGVPRSTSGLGRFPSGQREQTVNLPAHAFGGSNPPLPTKMSTTRGGSSSVARASAFQAEGRGFESRFPLQPGTCKVLGCPRGSVVEHVLGKDGVTGSIPVVGSMAPSLRTYRSRTSRS